MFMSNHRLASYPKILIALFALTIGLCSTMSASAATLIEPPAIPVPANLSESQIKKAIKIGLTSRGWIVQNEKSGYMEGLLNIRVHQVTVGITYDQSAVSIRYLDSKAMRYKEKNGKRKIHKNYNSWVNNIRRDIALELQKAAI